MKKILIVIIVLAILVMGFVFFKSSNPTGSIVKENIREITLNASRFQYNPDIIEVKKGDRIKININNLDTIHGIRIPDFNVKGNSTVEFIADKTGTFDFYCTVFCGDGHKDMKGTLIVK